MSGNRGADSQLRGASGMGSPSPYMDRPALGLRNRRAADTSVPSFTLSPPMTSVGNANANGGVNPSDRTLGHDASAMSFEEDAPPSASLLSLNDMTSPFLRPKSKATPNPNPTPTATGNGILALPSSAPGIDMRWATWVIVFGFQPGQAPAVLRYFQRFGDVVEHHRGGGNWLFLRYRTKLQAQKAVAQNGTTLGPNLMVAVAPLTPERARELGFDLDENGMAYADGGVVPGMMPPTTPSGGSVMFSPQHGSMRAKLRAAQEWGALDSSRKRYDALGANGDEDIMMAPAVKKRNICQRIMALLFNY
mmetsp:Transcript_33503/g.105851  ORF Transcript_33503/g.105851 Transcript_33503/m.105851 type:complete len:306 (-) Transcript_33503:261-1178(-)